MGRERGRKKGRREGKKGREGVVQSPAQGSAVGTVTPPRCHPLRQRWCLRRGSQQAKMGGPRGGGSSLEEQGPVLGR